MNQSNIGTTITSRLGYGCMRFPVDKEGNIDVQETERLLDRAMEGGITYYDTAWPYLGGQSEPVLGKIMSKYPRESFQYATKLPCWEIKSAEQAVERLNEQLERLQTEYVDFYLLHSLNRTTWRKMVELGVVEAIEEQQKAGKIRHYGFSFHDGYSIFEEIMNYRKWDFCQIQFNYMDTQHQAGMAGYHLAEKMGVPMVIMEPLKGGMLARLPEDIATPFTTMKPDKSVSYWGMRWLTSMPNIKVVLSGMSAMDQLEDNLATFQDVVPLTAEEQEAVAETTRHIKERLNNGCTACRYCLPCPAGVDIPANFRTWNTISVFRDPVEVKRLWLQMDEKERAYHCVGCGKCEKLCPQMIPIREHLSGITQEVRDFLHEEI